MIFMWSKNPTSDMVCGPASCIGEFVTPSAPTISCRLSDAGEYGCFLSDKENDGRSRLLVCADTTAHFGDWTSVDPVVFRQVRTG